MGIPSLLLQRLRGATRLRYTLSYSNRSNHFVPCQSPWLLCNCSLGSRNITQFEIKSSPLSRKVLSRTPAHRFLDGLEWTHFTSFHTGRLLSNTSDLLEPQNNSTEIEPVDDSGSPKVKRKKLKGKRAVVRFLKTLRWKKKKEYERMTAEEKILCKLKKARKKEERLAEALKKIEPSESSETTHDPEILTPEEHFYLLKMGHKSKNYVPVGRRGIFQGVILNMHLHWKKHQTLKVVVKTFTPEEVREIAAELARLSGGIVLDIHEDNTIIMYRGKNYSQPPTEIMSPKVTLSRKKALDKSKYRDALRAVRRFIPRLEQDLENLQTQMKASRADDKVRVLAETKTLDARVCETLSDPSIDNFDGFEEPEIDNNEHDGDDESSEEPGSLSGSEDLSDLFETDSDQGLEEKAQKPLYLDTLLKIDSEDETEDDDDFEKHLRRISAGSNLKAVVDSPEEDIKLSDLDEIDKIFLRADTLLSKKRR